MKVLVTADTHIPEWYRSLPNELLDAARQSDMILLAGDIVGPEVIDTLNGCAPLEAVYGNECYPDLKKNLPPKKVLTVGRWKVGLTHGHLGEGTSIDERAISLFDEKLDILVHGHSHHHHKKVVNDTLVIDPGSPVDTRFTDTHSFAILTLDDIPRVEFQILSQDRNRDVVDMLAFSAKWIRPILDGRKTVTFRKWPTARVKVNGIYDAATIGNPPKKFAKVKVTGLRKIRLDDIDDALARRDGAASAEDVRDYWKKQGFGPDKELWLVEFTLQK